DWVGAVHHLRNHLRQGGSEAPRPYQQGVRRVWGAPKIWGPNTTNSGYVSPTHTLLFRRGTITSHRHLQEPVATGLTGRRARSSAHPSPGGQADRSEERRVGKEWSARGAQ